MKSFRDRGIFEKQLVDAEVYPNYHSKNDTVTASNISLSQMTKTTKLVVAALAEYGMQ